MSVNNISVIIPTLNAGAMIDGLLSALKRQTITPAEIIVTPGPLSALCEGTPTGPSRAHSPKPM